MGSPYKIIDQTPIHFITTSTHLWVPILFNETVFQILPDSLKYCQANKGLNIHSYVIMPSHLHAIISHYEPQQTPNIIRDFKRHTAARIKTYLSDLGHQKGRVAHWYRLVEQLLDHIRSQPAAFAAAKLAAMAAVDAGPSPPGPRIMVSKQLQCERYQRNEVNITMRSIPRFKTLLFLLVLLLPVLLGCATNTQAVETPIPTLQSTETTVEEDPTLSVELGEESETSATPAVLPDKDKVQSEDQVNTTEVVNPTPSVLLEQSQGLTHSEREQWFMGFPHVLKAEARFDGFNDILFDANLPATTMYCNANPCWSHTIVADVLYSIDLEKGTEVSLFDCQENMPEVYNCDDPADNLATFFGIPIYIDPAEFSDSLEPFEVPQSDLMSVVITRGLMESFDSIDQAVPIGETPSWWAPPTDSTAWSEWECTWSQGCPTSIYTEKYAFDVTFTQGAIVQIFECEGNQKSRGLCSDYYSGVQFDKFMGIASKILFQPAEGSSPETPSNTSIDQTDDTAEAQEDEPTPEDLMDEIERNRGDSFISSLRYLGPAENIIVADTLTTSETWGCERSWDCKLIVVEDGHSFELWISGKVQLLECDSYDSGFCSAGIVQWGKYLAYAPAFYRFYTQEKLDYLEDFRSSLESLETVQRASLSDPIFSGSSIEDPWIYTYLKTSDEYQQLSPTPYICQRDRCGVTLTKSGFLFDVTFNRGATIDVYGCVDQNADPDVCDRAVIFEGEVGTVSSIGDNRVHFWAEISVDKNVILFDREPPEDFVTYIGPDSNGLWSQNLRESFQPRPAICTGSEANPDRCEIHIFSDGMEFLMKLPSQTLIFYLSDGFTLTEDADSPSIVLIIFNGQQGYIEAPYIQLID